MYRQGSILLIDEKENSIPVEDLTIKMTDKDKRPFTGGKLTDPAWFYEKQVRDYRPALSYYDGGYGYDKSLYVRIHCFHEDGVCLVIYKGWNGNRREEIFTMPEEELVRLGRILKPLRRWKRYYDREDVDDGWEWEIDYCFAGISIQTAGHESAPPFFSYYEKKLGKMLDAQYEAYGKDRQIPLEEVLEGQLAEHIEGLRMHIEDLRDGNASTLDRIMLKIMISQNQALLEIEGDIFLDELSDQELADAAEKVLSSEEWIREQKNRHFNREKGGESLFTRACDRDRFRAIPAAFTGRRK